MAKTIWSYQRANSNELQHAGFKYVKKIPLPGGGFRYIYPEDEMQKGPTDFAVGSRNDVLAKKQQARDIASRKQEIRTQRAASAMENDAAKRMTTIDSGMSTKNTSGPNDFQLLGTQNKNRDAAMAKKQQTKEEMEKKRKQKELRDVIKRVRTVN